MPTSRAAALRLLTSGSRRLAHSFRVAAALFLGTLWLACTRDETSVLGPPSLSHNESHTISGSVLGADGTNICNTIEEGTMLVRLLNPDFGFTSPDPFLGVQNITCPDNEYSFPVDAGTAHLRVQLPVNPGLDALPWRHLDEVPVGEEGVAHDVDILEGTELGGSATLDGNPFEGAFLQLVYEFNSFFGATNGTSGADGTWTEFFGRSPMILQNGVRYFAFGCEGTLGTRQLAGFPEAGFVFPTERDELDCTLETAPATQFSHTFTRVVVTPMPGDIGGGLSSDFFDQLGAGWGVQFPIALGSSPTHGPIDFSEIFNGGLLVGIGDDRVLAGADAGSMMRCGATCRDLGLDGKIKFSHGSGPRHVTWRYTDAASAEAVGLEVTQKSVDGKRPHDYVLFRFSIKNTSRSTLSLHAGFFGDWDIEFDAGDDLGLTDLGGKLMYQVSAGETGIHAGTMLLGAPVTGNFFFDGSEGAFPSTADQVRALSGELRQETDGPGDLRYIQGAGPITLKKKQRKDIWIAVVAGENKTQLLANAAAAEADVASRVNESLENGAEMSTITPGPAARAASRALSRPICKNCKPQ